MKMVRGMAAAAVMVLGLSLGLGVAGAQVAEWKIDGSHSEADFAIRHMGMSTVHGSFRAVSGVVRLDPVDVSKSGVEATIEVNSVDTGVAARDAHLKTDTFFDTAKFPTMVFKSTGVKKAGAGYEVAGLLTLHGVTKPVVLHMEPPSNEHLGMDKKAHRGFTATTAIDRKDYGLTWNAPVGGGDMMLGDEIKIELNIEAVKQ